MSPSHSVDAGKALAGERAADLVSPGMTLGLGTGSTVAFFLSALGRRFRDGELPGIVGVPTSLRTEKEAMALGLPLTSLKEAGALDLTVDGADEVDPELHLIKGLGGALLREKMIAQATEHFVIIVDDGKIVEQLGTRSPLPVEIVPFEWETHVPFIRGLGAEPVLRLGEDGSPFLTDNGNLILDCTFVEGILDPADVQEAMGLRAGVVETGLFLGLAHQVIIGGPRGVRSMERER